MGFALSRGGGAAGSWERLVRGASYDPCVEPSDLQFVAGHGFARDDLCGPLSCAGEPCWGGKQVDPGVAIGPSGYLYLVGLTGGPESPPFFSRMLLDKNTTAPLTGWETTMLPTGSLCTEQNCFDKPFVSADPQTEAVYVHWSSIGGPIPVPNSVFLTASKTSGDDFVSGNPPVDGVRLAYLPSELTWGGASVVGPDQRVHIVWKQKHGAGPSLDQIRYRRGEWNGVDLEFFPPLPPSGATSCTPNIDCELGIVDGGYGTLFGSPASGAVNFWMFSHPSIAVDPSDPANTCGRGGNLYAVYAASEQEPATADSNIYFIKSRDGGDTWSQPFLLNFPGEPEPGVVCNAPECPVTPAADGFLYRPLQFFPSVAVDGEGRVGVMWYDTTPDHGGLPGQTPCDGNVIFDIRFAFSLDGGVTWVFLDTVSEAASETGAFDFQNCMLNTIGEYAGMTAASDGIGGGTFHPIWMDSREWVDRDDANTMGDIYTTTIYIDVPAYPVGDYDRDQDVDMDDFAAIAVCANAGLPLPPLCEILDFDRDNDVDKNDSLLFKQCFTGRGGGTGGAGALPDLTSSTMWYVDTMTPPERAALSQGITEVAPATDAEESALILDFGESVAP